MKEAFCCNEVYETRLLTFSVTTTEKKKKKRENSFGELVKNPDSLFFVVSLFGCPGGEEEEEERPACLLPVRSTGRATDQSRSMKICERYRALKTTTLGVFARASRTGLQGGKKNDQSLAPMC